MTANIRKQINRILSNTAPTNKTAAAACMYAMEIVARIEHGEALPKDLASVQRRLDSLERGLT